MLDLARDEVVHDGVEDDRGVRPLEPRRLTRAREHGGEPRLSERVDELPRRRALSYRGVRSEDRDPNGADLLDLAGEEVELGQGGRLPDVADADATLDGGGRDPRILPEVIVQSAVDVKAELDGLEHVVAVARGEPAAVGREPDHEVRRGRPRGGCP